MKTRAHYLVSALLASATLAVACSPQSQAPTSGVDQNAAAPQGISNSELTINNNRRELAKRLTKKNQPVDIQADGFSTQADIPISDEVKLTLVAEVEPPTVGNQKVQATSIALNGDYIMVSYNTQGEVYKGALDVIDISDKQNPQLTSQCFFHQADTNAVSFENGEVFMAQGGNEQDIAPRTAYFRNIALLADGALDVPTNSRKVGVPGFVATQVFPTSDNVFVSSGDNAGLTVLDRVNFSMKKYIELHDARWVDAEDGKVAVVQGTPGKITVLDEDSLDVTNTFAIPGLDIPESKSTIDIDGGKAFVAAGTGGVQVVSLDNGQVVGNVPQPILPELPNQKTVTNAVAVDYDLAFISSGEAGIYVAKGDQAFGTSQANEDVNLRVLGKLSFGEKVSANHIAYKKDCLIVASGLGGVKILTIEYKVPEPEPTPPVDQSCKKMLAMNDSGSIDSQLVSLDFENGQATPIGPLYKKHDMESLDISPITGKMYSVAGNGGNQDGKLFEIDKTTGALTQRGDTGTRGKGEIAALSFHPNGELWAFQVNSGLHTIDLNSGALTQKWSVTSGIGKSWDGLAWDNNGEFLYGVDNKKLYKWDPTTQQVTPSCTNLPSGVESLEFRPDGILVGARQNRDKLTTFTVEVDNC